MTIEAEILFEERGPLSLVTLNRPQALNALTHNMCLLLDDQLKAHAGDTRIQAIVIKGAGEKAFCAGGDIRAIYNLGQSDVPATLKFYADEYRLNARIKHYAKPYIALMDGINMGGGVGVSMHGSIRVAGDRTLFAMPETGIGLFPDVGGSYFLPRCPGKLGMYLGLTGARLKAADLLYAGIATAYVPSDKMAALLEALASAPRLDHDAVGRIIADFAKDPGPAPIKEHRELIDRCFAGESVEAILAALTKEGSDFSLKTRDTLLAKSPTSLKITFRQLTLGGNKDFDDCMKMEYRMVNHILKRGDFFEGVRALIIDKDQQPKWNPADLAAVSAAEVDKYFAISASGDLEIY